jgi:hypothetical protein
MSIRGGTSQPPFRTMAVDREGTVRVGDQRQSEPPELYPP